MYKGELLYYHIPFKNILSSIENYITLYWNKNSSINKKTEAMWS